MSAAEKRPKSRVDDKSFVHLLNFYELQMELIPDIPNDEPFERVSFEKWYEDTLEQEMADRFSSPPHQSIPLVYPRPHLSLDWSAS